MNFHFLYFSYREAAIPYFILGLYGATILFNGRLRITVLSALAIIYTAIIIYVFIDPSFYNEVVEVAGDVTLTISSLVAMLVAIITIVFTLLAVLKSYIKQNKECIELNKRLERINHYDILTPCYNRKFIMEYLHMNSAQNSFNGITLVMFNLFELNVINQLYGYSYGDNLLVELAEILFQSLKGRGLVSRFDGTRFVVVLNMTAEEEINKFITEALNSFDAYTQKSKNDLFILSHGYVVCKGVFQVDDKIKEIDNECYNSAAKLKGRSHSDELLYSELRSRNDIHKSNNI